jgi:hypothetical protein
VEIPAISERVKGTLADDLYNNIPIMDKDPAFH